MKKINEKLLTQLKEKKTFLNRSIFITSIAENVVNYVQIILNLIILLIALITIWLAVEIKLQTNRVSIVANQTITDEGFAFTIVVASFMILLFFLSMFIAAYKIAMRYEEYRKIFTALEYISLKKGDNYSYEEFNNDYNALRNKYLGTKALNLKQILKATIKGDRGAK